MKRIITYGTFDLFHYGHIYLLKRAKAQGDHLTVAISTDEFNRTKGKESHFSYEKRKECVESIKYVDCTIPEVSWEQKTGDIKELGIDVLVIGHDWEGKFDYLRKSNGCEVVYLERTPEISTSRIKQELGIEPKRTC